MTKEFLDACKIALRDAKPLDHLWIRATAFGNEATVEFCRNIPMPGCDPDEVRQTFTIAARPRVEMFHAGPRGTGQPISAHSVHYTTSDRSALRSIVGMCREGDQIDVHFLIGNETES